MLIPWTRRFFSVPAMQVRRQSDSAVNSPRRSVLRRLPVPDLRDTLDRYLKSLEPFLLEDSARGGFAFDEAMKKRIAWANEFEHGVGQVCQKRLLELDKASPYNWLDDNFWLKKAYHEWRSPLLVNSNWWLAFENDANVPEDVIEGRSVSSMAGITPWQVRRATWLLQRLLKFKENVEIQPEGPMTKTGLWMQEASSALFNICRIPQPRCDRLSDPPNTSSPEARKIVLILHDWFYSIDVYDHDGKFIGFTETEKRILEVVLDAEARLLSGEKASSIGILTADHRDIWTRNREHLMELSPTNQNILRSIETSILALCLDSYTLGGTPSFSLQHNVEVDNHLHNIRSGRNAHNRWFDKPITLIVESNTRAGMMGEHSPCDALIPSIFADYALTDLIEVDNDIVDHPSLAISNVILPDASPGWERLDWVVDDRILQECVEAEARARAIIADSDDSLLCFKDYGWHFIKVEAKLSPDAYVQMALQLAWYRTRGSFTATYETTLTRLFRHGRTETIRTFSADSRKFVLSMEDPTVSQISRYEFLQQANKTHVSLSWNASTGKGFDRHLLGLKLVMEEGESSALLEDELFQRSQDWKLSTSGLSEGERFRGTGFGAMYPDGYGINYLTAPLMIKFGIESKTSCPLTSTDEFKNALIRALREMNQVCREGQRMTLVESQYPQAKL